MKIGVKHMDSHKKFDRPLIARHKKTRTPHSRPAHYITYITYTTTHYTHGKYHEHL